MIISASYKTDIPAFYGEWFMNRLRAGSCKMVNPYGHQIYQVNLKRERADASEGVDGIVFWTKNIGPLMQHLPEIQNRGYPFAVQYTINGYPRELEARVVDYDRTVAHMHDLAAKYPESHRIWRYDPILITSKTPLDWHEDKFGDLAAKLHGATAEVVVSFAQMYKKTKRNLDRAAEEQGFDWYDHERIAGEDEPANAQALALLRSLAEVAQSHGMQLRVCSQKRYVIEGKVEEARCIDASWFGQKYKRHGNRPECACSASRDIGEYDTCPHGCVYCYAVVDREKALGRYKQHNPSSEFLFEPEFPIGETLTPTKQKGAKPEKSLTILPQPLFVDEE